MKIGDPGHLNENGEFASFDPDVMQSGVGVNFFIFAAANLRKIALEFISEV